MVVWNLKDKELQSSKLKNTEADVDFISWLNQWSLTTNYAVTSLDIKQIKIKNDIIEWIQKKKYKT